ncbi:MAG: radical SAM family heme chaperone HemW [Treponemataceae bacterium]|nr:radical SAM family heme chaperone HemW [Treponemataceae bacterium]
MPLYIHIPFCLKKCDYCDFFSKVLENSRFIVKNFTISDYIEAVLNQISFLIEHFSVKNFTSVYIGGGTPSVLSANQLKILCERIAPFAKGAEFTIEANPGDLSKEFLQAAASGGINRLSLGIQCKNDEVLRAVGRRTTVSQIEGAISMIGKFWRGAWSADFIAGLPFQTKEMLASDIEFAAENGASHISLYSLSVEEGTPLAENIRSGRTRHDADFADEIWIFGREILEKKGFFQYEISNFAKKGFESRHNLSYWTLCDYLGAGAGATGTMSGKRFTNTRDIAKYIEFWKNAALETRRKNAPGKTEILDFETREFEFLMMGLRTLRGVGAREYERRFGGNLASRLGADKADGVFSTWQKKGLASTTRISGETFFSLTRDGILFLNKFLRDI